MGWEGLAVDEKWHMLVMGLRLALGHAALRAGVRHRGGGIQLRPQNYFLSLGHR